MKRKSLVVLVVVVLTLLTFSGCSNKDDVVTMVERVENLNHELSIYNISYDEYMKEIKNYFNSEYTEKKLFNRIIPGAIGITESKEEFDYKSYYENERKQFFKNNFAKYEIKTKISKTYDLEEDIKNVFVKTELTFEGTDDTNSINLVLTKKYVIVKENDKWKISRDYIDFHKKENPKKLNYTTFNNEPVDYITTVTMKPVKINK
ncbi:hypothetical protein PV797_18625 [Clostridiaceae bacterium M8S5]|nr:hypothetical protein PV797_18625 [Clostridiaceae bacterium M8S5]